MNLTLLFEIFINNWWFNNFKDRENEKMREKLCFMGSLT